MEEKLCESQSPVLDEDLFNTVKQKCQTLQNQAAALDARKKALQQQAARKKELAQSLERDKKTLDDIKARQWIEIKIRARDTILATRNGLTDCGEELLAAQREKIETALRNIEQALETEDPVTRIGDILKLKAANTALDNCTRPLADLVMDKAMEALLKKRGLI